MRLMINADGIKDEFSQYIFITMIFWYDCLEYGALVIRIS